MFACLNRKNISDEKVVEELKDDTKAIIYRDELTKKTTFTSPPPSIKTVKMKKSVRFADSEHTILGEEKNFNVKGRCSSSAHDIELGERGAGIRVKVKMTKEEAARLLSKCKQGGVLEFKDVARELVELPANRVSVIVPT